MTIFGLSITQFAMTAAGIVYVIAAIGWWVDHRNTWMAWTFVLYAATAFTLYMAGRTDQCPIP